MGSMLTPPEVSRAKALAEICHAGHADKAGRPYTEHLERVAESVGRRAEEAAVAYLHDIVEDTPCTLDHLVRLGFDEELIVRPVEILTRRDGETYFDYIRRIAASGDATALAVKRADLLDHLRDTAAIPDGLAKRYRKALAMIDEAA